MRRVEWGESPRESVTVKPPGEDESDTRQPDGFSAGTGRTFVVPPQGHDQVRSAALAAGRFFVFPPEPMGRRRETIYSLLEPVFIIGECQMDEDFSRQRREINAVWREKDRPDGVLRL